ncbi:hypothetical protein CHLNCDRAFT_135376 [Chlorella variabilis]|uniref:Uncharacterized protein n=1 Tax=Chlorella variabilis TaxID=554065 RepID=E1ZI34_CHLVA|nr:hypothetical protein CHLNCDRAFT_135376 [Chlorella variabilis]EFN54710.1 hypothetical protein CHLNCDRAFT_135376 [Chlorella variabilis]|eukprot:XP_005846812.1 hypothetical protein CHLNCDRAFT_135376 [Chlorella variabilis]
MQGITYDKHRRVLYTAMSAVRYGMEDNQAKGKAEEKYDVGGPNHIRVGYNKCGCIYQLPVDKQYSALSMKGLVCGRPNPNEADEANECDLTRIASPDNVAYMPEIDALLIGEDTDYHENDALWSLDIKTKRLQRLLTTPYGAEVTSPYWFPNINAHAYVMAAVQHPYEDPYDVKLGEPESSGADGWVGYFTWRTSAMAGARSASFVDTPVPMTNAAKHGVNFSKKVSFLPKKASRKM